MKNIILIGAGGHCKVCIDIIEQIGQQDILGVHDARFLSIDNVLGYKILGDDKRDLKTYYDDYDDKEFAITFGFINGVNKRKELYLKLLGAYFYHIVDIVSPKSYVSKHSYIGYGATVMNGVIINPCATIGDNCIINSNALIEHDTTIGSHCHISTGAVINGTCFIGNDCFIGSNSVVNNDITIRDNVIIGSGSVVNRDILEPGTYVGNPVRKIK
jgi:sugar O-acyltransferase (sialic acid O-acetyltransferase NeuD family)